MFTLIYYSPTGNAQHLARILARELKCTDNTLPLEFTDPLGLKSNDHLVLLYPVHGFNAPRIVKRFVGKIKPGLFNKVSLIAVGTAGNWLNAAASKDLRKSLNKKGYPVMVDEQLAMPLTIIMNLPDDLNRRFISESEKTILVLSEQIKQEKKSEHKVPVKSRIVNFLGKAEAPAARMFGLELHANIKCTSCGTCWNRCPQKNIKQKSKGRPGFGFNCSMCMRCIYQCPEKAISPRISKFIPVKGGYTINKYLD